MMRDMKTDDDVNHGTDYYAYLDAPENMTRYLPMIEFMKAASGRRLRVLDVGCGRGSICRYLPEAWDYTGLDHSPAAIGVARLAFPTHDFRCLDAPRFLIEASRSHGYDVIVLCGVLSHIADASGDHTLPNADLVDLCCNALSVGGHLAILTPFAYVTGYGGKHFYAQATWKDELVSEAVSSQNDISCVYRNVSDQIGVEKAIARQKSIPRWWSPPTLEPSCSRFHGTYLGTLTTLMRRKG